MRRNLRTFVPLQLAALIFLAGSLLLARPIQDEGPTEEDLKDRLVPYVPSPESIVDAMLQLARVDKHDHVYDLGSGDGRIVIMAAQKYHADAVGVEIDDDLYKKSTERIAELGLQDHARILHMNMYKVNLKPATVVTLYLLTSVNERLKPILERDLRPGARVVTHDFKIPGWEPSKTQDVMSEAGYSKKIFLYVRP
jgi:SAM-dependent methyltransferase